MMVIENETAVESKIRFSSITSNQIDNNNNKGIIELEFVNQIPHVFNLEDSR